MCAYLAWSSTAIAQGTPEAYPVRPVRVVVGLAPGGEAGVPGYVTTTWHGWLAPASTSAVIVQRLSGEIAKVVKSPEIIEKMSGDGGVAVGSTPEEFTRYLLAEMARWRKVVKETGVRVE
jgi:tripartite-type tricarboxylate transporter receptor subunit TctC